MQVATPQTASSDASRSAAAEGIALIVAVCIYTATASMHLFQPLLDAHAFRQCQTAVTAEYLAQDLSPWRMFVYETPLLGAPWRIPMEFPLFQWIVALLHRATGAEIDLAGRVTAMLFHLACLWPAWSITRSLGGGFREWAVFATLMLLAPVYHHWSRSCLIETTAVFLALGFLAAAIAWVQNGRAWALALGTMTAVLAAVVKVTTFPPFAGAAVCYGLWLGLSGSVPRRAAIVRTAVLAVPFGVALACLIAWVQASDAVKAASPVAVRLTSAALGDWNYGSLAQRLSSQLWLGTIARRAIPEAGGWLGVAVAAAALVWLRDSRRLLIGFLLLTYIGTFLLFTNLHVVHNYYQAANGAILIAAITVALAAVSRGWKPIWTAVLLAAVILPNLWSFRFYAADEWRDFSRDGRLAAAAVLQERVPADDVIVVAGMDWSSEIACYAHRRAVYITNWFPNDVLARFVADPTTLTGDHALGACLIVRGAPQFSRRDWGWNPDNNQLLQTLFENTAGGTTPIEIGPLIIAVAKQPPGTQPEN